MAVFFALLSGIGTAVGAFLGYAVGYAVGLKDGTAAGQQKTRDTFERVLAIARMRTLADENGGSELADLVMTLFNETK